MDLWSSRKSQIRSTESEMVRPVHHPERGPLGSDVEGQCQMIQIQMTKIMDLTVFLFGTLEPLYFEFVSHFGFRYSNLVAATGRIRR